MPEASKNDLIPCGSTCPPQASQFTVPAAAAGRGDPPTAAAASAPPVIAAALRNSRRFTDVVMRALSSPRRAIRWHLGGLGFRARGKDPGVLLIPTEVHPLSFLEPVHRTPLHAIQPVRQRLLPV